MLDIEFQILPTHLLDQYKTAVSAYHLPEAFSALKDAELSTGSFSFYTSVASVYSSKIEGEEIELDSYVKHKRFGVSFLPDHTRKIDDLYNAYVYAQAHPLNEENIKEVHRILAQNIVAPASLGTVRQQNMYVTTPDGRIEYVAADPRIVTQEMDKLYSDIDTLLTTELSFEEVLFFGSLLHLVFVKIHPWSDGNGRTARLLEKWFIAQKAGSNAWFLQSEQYYYTHHATYYNNIRVMGLEYIESDYSKALPFLLMLPAALQEKDL